MKSGRLKPKEWYQHGKFHLSIPYEVGSIKTVPPGSPASQGFQGVFPRKRTNLRSYAGTLFLNWSKNGHFINEISRCAVKPKVIYFYDVNQCIG